MGREEKRRGEIQVEVDIEKRREIEKRKWT